jgi:hypothetical protein
MQGLNLNGRSYAGFEPEWPITSVKALSLSAGFAYHVALATLSAALLLHRLLHFRYQLRNQKW